MRITLNGIDFRIHYQERGEYTVEGPPGIVRTYNAGFPNAHADVICAHLGVVGSSGLIDHITANVSRQYIEQQIAAAT